MTTTVKISVNGNVRSHVHVNHANGTNEEHIVDGAEGSGEITLTLRDPPDAVITISEEPAE
jgi:hypothetical protein